MGCTSSSPAATTPTNQQVSQGSSIPQESSQQTHEASSAQDPSTVIPVIDTIQTEDDTHTNPTTTDATTIPQSTNPPVSGWAVADAGTDPISSLFTFLSFL